MAEEFALIQSVFEGFAAINEDDGDFVGEAAAQFLVALDIDFTPGEAAPAVQLGERLFHDFTQVATLAGVDHYLTRLRHQRSLAGLNMVEKDLATGIQHLAFSRYRYGP
jgi:hypothetical protein